MAKNAPDSPWSLALGKEMGQIYVTNVGGKVGGLRHFDGEKWSLIAGTRGNAVVTSGDGLVVTSAGDRNTLVSSDWGQNWTTKTYKTTSVFEPTNWVAKEEFVYPPGLTTALDPHNPNRVLFGDSFGIHATDDVTAPVVKWTPMLEGYETTVPWALASPPVGPRLYYACADVNGFIWDDDVSQLAQQQLWSRVYPNDKGGVGPQAGWDVKDSVVSDIEWAPSKPENQVITRSTWKGYYSPYARIYRSTDAGKTWRGDDAPAPTMENAPASSKAGGAAKIAISSTDPNRMVYVRPMSVPLYTENGFWRRQNRMETFERRQFDVPRYFPLLRFGDAPGSRCRRWNAFLLFGSQRKKWQVGKSTFRTMAARRGFCPPPKNCRNFRAT